MCTAVSLHTTSSNLLERKHWCKITNYLYSSTVLQCFLGFFYITGASISHIQYFYFCATTSQRQILCFYSTTVICKNVALQLGLLLQNITLRYPFLPFRPIEKRRFSGETRACRSAVFKRYFCTLSTVVDFKIYRPF